jgi:GT2 family glycosyltransferase
MTGQFVEQPKAAMGTGGAGRPDLQDTTPTIGAIVVSFNTRQMTLECLRTLLEQLDGVRAEVILVDNGSSDGTVAAVEGEFPQVRVIANERNLGFGAANNQAMRVSRAGYFLLLNSDAFPKQGAIKALLNCLEGNPRAAVAGPRLENADGSVQVSCFPFPTPLRAWLENLWIPKVLPPASWLGDYRRWRHDTPGRVPWVIGACMLVRREAWQRVGGFDERFFMYAEETDWQARMREAGWEIEFTPSACVKHLGGGSGAAERARISEHFFRSLDLYELKHHGLLGLALLRMAMIAGACLRIPGWAACLAAPKRRTAAGAKLRLLCWLLARQATRWKINGQAKREPQTGASFT